uniref:hypothetical protein n=1 Tax=Sporichthya sp. TaxID=65475 RepID=UPI001858DDBB
VSPRAVRSVDVLLAEEPALTARTGEQLPPPRPAMDDAVFTELEVAEIAQVKPSWTLGSLVSIRRGLALTVLTTAIYVGATAWIPATPAITDQPAPTVASAKLSQH